MAKIQIKCDKHSIGKELNGPSWRNLTKIGHTNKGQTRLVVHCLTFASNNKFLLLNLSFVFGKKRFYLSSHTPLIVIFEAALLALPLPIVVGSTTIWFWSYNLEVLFTIVSSTSISKICIWGSE